MPGWSIVSRFGATGCTMLLALMLSSCATGPALTAALEPFPARLDTEEAPATQVSPLLGVNEDMQAFLDLYVGDSRKPLSRLESLLDHIHNKAYLGMRYMPSADYGAQQAFSQREANCLSYSALVISMAREIGLNARFQLAPMLPNWRLRGDTYLVEQHVNVAVRIRNHDYLIDFEPPDNLSSSRPRLISDREAQAMLHGNLGAQALAAGRTAEAYALFRDGLTLDPDSTALWINLGVSLVRSGHADLAEQAYNRALALDPGNLSALNNLMILRMDQGEEVSELERRLERHRKSNPYYLYWNARQKIAEGRLLRAEELLEEAIAIRPDEIDFYIQLSEVARLRGDTVLARQRLQAALSHAYTASQRARVEKLLAD